MQMICTKISIFSSQWYFAFTWLAVYYTITVTQRWKA